MDFLKKIDSNFRLSGQKLFCDFKNAFPLTPFLFARLLPFPFRLSKGKEQRVFFCGVASLSSSGGAGFLIGGFAQRMFEHQSKTTAKL
ncbi:MAG: hypothetical protein AAB337_00385, partial [Patescibacteria group bacterium]